MLTANEALDRAMRIWGFRRIVTVHTRPDGGADVNLIRVGAASDTRGQTYSYHRLDGNGHAVCHDDCRVLEGAQLR
jgi:hypothetical protein